VWAKIEKVVIWGHKLHSHTHSYVHYGFYRAFEAMGYPTLWLDNSDNIEGLDFHNTLFISEHQVDQKIPIELDSYYVIHHPSSERYDAVKKKGHLIDLRAYSKKSLSTLEPKKIEPYIFYDVPNRAIVMPWATDLLPEEIEANKARSPLLKKRARNEKKVIYWVGTIGKGVIGNYEQITPFKQACKKHKVSFKHSDPWKTPVSPEENVELILKSYLAPIICGQQQLDNDYIPCRAFKNISYGHIGVTNSRIVYELFGKRIVYNADTAQLFVDAEKRLKKIKPDELFELMDFVSKHHTYLNRAQHLLDFIALLPSE
jgi:hypothetical protein